MPQSTAQLVLPTLQEALALLSRRARPANLVQFQPVMGQFRMVPPAAPRQSEVRTLQNHESKGRIVQVYTEFATNIPVGQGPAGSGRSADPQGMAALAFGLVIGYQFEEEEAEISRVVFAKVNAVLHGWSYWRTFTHQSLAQMGISAAVAPLLSVRQAASMAGLRDDSAGQSAGPRLP
jgi:hypothetical protein